MPFEVRTSENAPSSSSSQIVSPLSPGSTSNWNTPGSLRRPKNTTMNGSNGNGVASLRSSSVTSPPRHSIQSPPSYASSLMSPPAASNSFAQAYIDQSRNLLDSQRRVFEQERELFAQERMMWETERQALYARIKELEEGDAASSRGRSTTRRAVDSASAHTIPADQLLREHPASSVPEKASSSGGGSSISNSRVSSASHNGLAENEENGSKFWEGPPSRHSSTATRTFPPSTSTGLDEGRLASISEMEDSPHRHHDGTSSSTKSPEPKLVGTGIDVSVINESLDGINLKQSAVALPPSILVNSLSSPPSNIGPHSSGVASTTKSHLTDLPPHPNAIVIDHNTKDAGHTPNAPRRMSMASGTSISPDRTVPDEHDDVGSDIPTPTALTHHGRRLDHELPSGISIPPSVDDDDYDDGGDVALRGPLTLRNDPDRDEGFLEVLDEKLMEEARRIVYSPTETASSVSMGDVVERSRSPETRRKREGEENDDSKGEESDEVGEMDREGRLEGEPEPEIKLRLKRSMNFGTAFGSVGGKRHGRD